MRAVCCNGSCAGSVWRPVTWPPQEIQAVFLYFCSCLLVAHSSASEGCFWFSSWLRNPCSLQCLFLLRAPFLSALRFLPSLPLGLKNKGSLQLWAGLMQSQHSLQSDFHRGVGQFWLGKSMEVLLDLWGFTQWRVQGLEFCRKSFIWACFNSVCTPPQPLFLWGGGGGRRWRQCVCQCGPRCLGLSFALGFAFLSYSRWGLCATGKLIFLRRPTSSLLLQSLQVEVLH